MHLFPRIFSPHTHRRLRGLTQWLKISGLLWHLVHWSEMARSLLLWVFSQTKEVSLGSLTVAGSFLSQQDCLAFTIQQMLVVKDLRWEFLTKLQLAQSFPAVKNFNSSYFLLFMKVDHSLLSNSPTEGWKHTAKGALSVLQCMVERKNKQMRPWNGGLFPCPTPGGVFIHISAFIVLWAVSVVQFLMQSK